VLGLLIGGWPAVLVVAAAVAAIYWTVSDGRHLRLEPLERFEAR
jgi:hypothetical protein